MNDHDLERDVSDELEWDPRLPEGTIAVSAHDGLVTLRGTVGSLRQKHEAKRAAKRVYGVKGVENRLEVRLMTSDRRDDAEVRADVLSALNVDSLVPDTVDARVDDGLVTLTGTAEWQFQREEAAQVAGNVLGVRDVDDKMELASPTPDPGVVQNAIEKAFERNAKIDAEDIRVTSVNGTVTLEGVVDSWAERDDAVSAAWATPGVTNVEDRLQIAY